MSPAIRRFVACLLFVLLPFQALATGIGACNRGMGDCPEHMMQMMDCCNHGENAPSDASCGAAFSCMSLAAPAVPLQAATAPVFPQRSDALPAPDLLPESHIPDALQRPPRSLS